jgi:hypothetical protein
MRIPAGNRIGFGLNRILPLPLSELNMTVLVPYVVEKNGREERAMDIYSRLLRDRIVFLGTQVNDVVSNSIVAQLLFLQFDDPKADIHFYINSPGGSITAGMAIYDTMQYISCDVATYCGRDGRDCDGVGNSRQGSHSHQAADERIDDEAYRPDSV